VTLTASADSGVARASSNRELLRLPRKRNFEEPAATKQHHGQITQKSVKPVWKKYSDFPKWQISLGFVRLTR
jgi:hypothetical protein